MPPKLTRSCSSLSTGMISGNSSRPFTNGYSIGSPNRRGKAGKPPRGGSRGAEKSAQGRGPLTRRTFRTFERRPVPADLRTRVLDAASWAPSAEDADCVRFVVIDDPVLKKRLFALTRELKDISNHWEALFRSSGLRGYVQDWTHTPLCIAVCVDPAARPRHIHDNWSHRLAGAAASQNLALAASYHGLAMGMYTHFSQEKLKQLLDVPVEWEVDGVMGIGFPDLGRINPRVLETSLVRPALGELVSSERYGDPAPKELTEDRPISTRVPDLITVIRGLRATRRFTDAPVPAEHLF